MLCSQISAAPYMAPGGLGNWIEGGLGGIYRGYFAEIRCCGRLAALGIGSISPRVHNRVSVEFESFSHMSTLAEFSAQLERCAQSGQEARDFVEAFSKVRLRYIARATAAAAQPKTRKANMAARGRSPLLVSPDWQDPAKLMASGLIAEQLAASADPATDWLHVDIAMDPASAEKVRTFVWETGLSDKQRRALFPGLSRVAFSEPAASGQRRGEVPG